MVLDARRHKLYVFGGQRDDKHLSDMFEFDTMTEVVTEISPDVAASGGPDAYSSYRAVIDSDLGEIYA
jgi:muskelin